MLKRHHQITAAGLFLADAAGTSLAFTAAFVIYFRSGLFTPAHGEPPLAPYLTVMPAALGACLLAYRYHDLYLPRRTGSFRYEVLDLFKATFTATLAVLAVSFFIRVSAEGSRAESRGVLALFFVLNPISLALFRGSMRLVIWSARRRGYNLRHALIVGTGKLGQRVAERLQANPWTGLQLLGFIEAGLRDRKVVRGHPVLGRVDDLERVLRERTVDQVFIALPFEQSRTIRKTLDLLSREPVAVTLVPDVYDLVTLRSAAADFDGLPIIHLRENPAFGTRLLLKRLIDVGVALVGLVLTSPLLLAISIGIYASDGRPILYGQERMGLDGRRFRMLKFRTMRRDAEALTGAVWATRNDPRATRLGRWLRRLSLDELPQLVNVLRGEMSIVGPRPERPELIEQFKFRIPRYMLRCAMKAGITGWAQVNGWRGDTSLKKRIQFDLFYIRNWSLLFDIKIIALTLVRGFYHRNAH